jgi:hypothetical protein
MIVKGILKTINYNDNTCVVRLPLFEAAGANEEVVLPAIISIQPGIFNGYKVDDVVLVSFENNNLNHPIVLGKLYLGAATENKDARGSLNVTNLNVTSTATLPITTKLAFTGDTNSIIDVEIPI